jgi:hypothetical protein
VFSEICGEKSFRSRRPGPPVKMPCVAVASSSITPLKALRRTSSKKSKVNTNETTSSSVQHAKTKSLESTKRKRKSSEQVSDVELQAASSLAQMTRKKAKKAVKKIVAAEVRRVPSAFDDDIFAEPSQKGFSSWPFLRFNFHAHCTPGSENEFVDIDSFSYVVAKEMETSVAAAETADSQPVDRQDEASPEFTKELDMTVHKGEDPAPEVPFVETRENLPEDRDPSPSMIAFNKSFGTSYRGEILSIGYEQADARDGTPKLLTLWNRLKSWVKQEKDPQRKNLCQSSELLKICLLLPQVRRLLVELLLRCLPEKVHEFDYFFYLCFYLAPFNFLLTFVLMNLPDFEKLLQKYPADKIEKYQRDYSLKASRLGKVASQRLVDQEKINKKLLDDSKKLSHGFKLSRAANSNLEKKVSERAEALKKC